MSKIASKSGFLGWVVQGLAVVVVGVGLLLAGCTSAYLDARAAGKIAQRGDACEKEGNVDCAIEQYELALKTNDRDSTSIVRIIALREAKGDECLKAGNFDCAISNYESIYNRVTKPRQYEYEISEEQCERDRWCRYGGIGTGGRIKYKISKAKEAKEAAGNKREEEEIVADPDKAIAHYTGIIVPLVDVRRNSSSENEVYYQARYNRGLAYFAKRDFDNAVKDFEAGINLGGKFKKMLMVAIDSSVVARGLTPPKLGYDNVRWGMDIQEVRNVYKGLKEISDGDASFGLRKFFILDNNGSIMGRAFWFYRDKLYRVVVNYKDVRPEDLRDKLCSDFVRGGGQKCIVWENMDNVLFGRGSYQEITSTDLHMQYTVQMDSKSVGKIMAANMDAEYREERKKRGYVETPQEKMEGIGEGLKLLGALAELGAKSKIFSYVTYQDTSVAATAMNNIRAERTALRKKQEEEAKQKRLDNIGR